MMFLSILFLAVFGNAIAPYDPLATSMSFLHYHHLPHNTGLVRTILGEMFFKGDCCNASRSIHFCFSSSDFNGTWSSHRFSRRLFMAVGLIVELVRIVDTIMAFPIFES